MSISRRLRLTILAMLMVLLPSTIFAAYPQTLVLSGPTYEYEEYAQSPS